MDDVQRCAIFVPKLFTIYKMYTDENKAFSSCQVILEGYERKSWAMKILLK
jgi:hypothetical protein